MRRWSPLPSDEIPLRGTLPFSWVPAYAYSPRENVGSNGSNHIQLLEAAPVGRSRRNVGDALCKPRTSFWGLTARQQETPTSFEEITCLTCRRMAARLLPAFTDVGERAGSFRDARWAVACRHAQIVDALAVPLDTTLSAPLDGTARVQVILPSGHLRLDLPKEIRLHTTPFMRVVLPVEVTEAQPRMPIRF